MTDPTRETVFVVMLPIIIDDLVQKENTTEGIFQSEKDAEDYAKKLSAERFLVFRQEKKFSGKQLDKMEELRPMDAFVVSFTLY